MINALRTDRFTNSDDPIDLVKPFLDGSESPLMTAWPRAWSLEDDDASMVGSSSRGAGRWADGYSGYNPATGTYTVPSSDPGESTTSSQDADIGTGGAGDSPSKFKPDPEDDSGSVADAASPGKSSKTKPDSKTDKSSDSDGDDYSGGGSKAKSKPGPDIWSVAKSKDAKSWGKGYPGTGQDSGSFRPDNPFSGIDSSLNTSLAPSPSYMNQALASFPSQEVDNTQSSSVSSLPAAQPQNWGYSLTKHSPNAVINEPNITDAGPGLFEKIGNGVKDLFGRIFDKGTNDDDYDGITMPVSFPQKGDLAKTSINPDFFRDGYISQRDLESALGRDPWTLCCASTLVYAIQAKHPEISRTDLYTAVATAAKTQLNDDSGPCVSANGRVNSIYQYSQALSKSLGLDDYVDTPGSYHSLEEAQKAGFVMSKVELSGKISEKTFEHHVFQAGSNVIDPIPGGGFEAVVDEGTIQVENVMALDWYPMP